MFRIAQGQSHVSKPGGCRKSLQSQQRLLFAWHRQFELMMRHYQWFIQAVFLPFWKLSIAMEYQQEVHCWVNWLELDIDGGHVP